MTLTFRSLAYASQTNPPAEPTLGRDEMAVYDALVRADAALTLDDLFVELDRRALADDLPDAVASLVADGLVWTEGNLVGLVPEG